MYLYAQLKRIESGPSESAQLFKTQRQLLGGACIIRLPCIIRAKVPHAIMLRWISPRKRTFIDGSFNQHCWPIGFRILDFFLSGVNSVELDIGREIYDGSSTSSFLSDFMVKSADGFSICCYTVLISISTTSVYPAAQATRMGLDGDARVSEFFRRLQEGDPKEASTRHKQHCAHGKYQT